ncbi:mycothiol synthase [Actinotalea solisilvae]|uniref:mycothiol synthase n=1 Tax=Actinotalea solisilvae TaxID=2072922 RepID=UPI0018F185EA|nr:mycothiol synthase [Actinotalea solisilvae]
MTRELPPVRTVGPGTDLTPDEAAAVRALAAAAHEHDGVEALGEQTLLDLRGGAPVRHLLLAPPPHAAPSHGRPAPLLGYAAVRHADDGAAESAELVVDPAHRRRGAGTALLAAVRAAGDPPVWAHGNLPGARALAARAGRAVVRELWQMAVPLPAPGAASGTAPEGVVVRPFVVGQDEEAWLRVNARAFAEHPEQGRMTLADLRAREAEPWFDPGDLLLAEQDGRLVASVWMKVEPGCSAGELYVLGVDPDAQGRGIGRLLTARVLEHLADRGLREAVLYVSADDAVAVRTYERAGFTVARADVQYR